MAKTKITVRDLAAELGVSAARLKEILVQLGVSEKEAQQGLDEETAQVVKEMAQEMVGDLKTLVLPRELTVRELADVMERSPTELQRHIMTKHGKLLTPVQKVDPELAEKVAADFGLTVQWETPQPTVSTPTKVAVTGPQPRPPVVTIMGHVDHGKTSLLDYIRKTRVAEREFGGITQHIGAYQAEVNGKLITFLDTPGHEAFTAMRARGAQVTDIVVLVVAADDGIMPQTVEAINHAKNAKVPIIVAINKIDKPEANPDRVMQQLTQYELIPEAWGGDTICVPVSAITGEGVDTLLEMILLVAELAELKADPKAELQGAVIEAKLDKGRGPLATILVQQGTLKRGDILVVGKTWGKIRAMFDHTGKSVDSATPSTPVEVMGLNEVPIAGDKVERVESEARAREIVEERLEAEKRPDIQRPTRRVNLAELFQQMQAGETKTLSIILKADTYGSVEAIRDALLKLKKPEGVELKIINANVGNISEADIDFAIAADAVVLGFNVKVESNAQTKAKASRVDVRVYRIIYELLEEVEKALHGLLEPEFKEVTLGTAEVRAVFKLSRGIVVAGCYVLDGKIVRNAPARLIRNGEVIHESKISTLRHLKEDRREIAAGYECGLTLEGFTDYQEGDRIECYEIQEVGR
ncbi:MAG: translation initiation factor IF-2 [Armatimonadetes bacterium JP3_11]|jgi:translation initiation factor IF-2|nr:MAG: translation initiation factor IF-2 [Armatimonadetes bacterium CP1_7O]OYT74264.1 MAG: translation initiation factor IF-2 [Armatimonadetes bacterium JP3_11]RMH06976.1 MAG: translation initiation factor IF-2 [Armatimonadota bacterium]